jgi:hypothetical protein
MPRKCLHALLDRNAAGSFSWAQYLRNLLKGSVLKARIARDGMLEVVGAQHLPLYPHEWELVLTDEELERFLERAREGREEELR